MNDNSALTRTRWAAIGAALAVTLGAGSIGVVQATLSDGERPVLVQIEPCRLADTRPAHNVGPRSAALGPDEAYTVDATGNHGDCTIPNAASGLSLNVTAVGPTAPTFLTIYPAGTTRPLVSSLNPIPGAGPTPNAVVTAIDGQGRFDIYNLAGDVDVIIDVNGYYEDHDHDDRYGSQVETYYSFDPADLKPFGQFGGVATQSTQVHPITTERDGRLRLSKGFAAEFSCTTPTQARAVFLLLDGVPVPSTAVWTREESWHAYELAGVTDDVVPAGEHVVTTGYSCASAWTGIAFAPQVSLTVEVLPG